MRTRQRFHRHLSHSPPPPETGNSQRQPPHSGSLTPPFSVPTTHLQNFCTNTELTIVPSSPSGLPALHLFANWLKGHTCSGAQSCPILCDPVDCSPPGSCIHGILQARILEWAAMPFSRGSSWPRDQTRVSCTAGGYFTAKPPGKSAHTRNSGPRLCSLKH